MKFEDYVRRNPVFHPPRVAESLGVTVSQVLKWTADLWHKFPNPHVVDNMIHTQAPNQKWVYETCDTPYRRGRYFPADSIQDWWLRNQRENQHYSMFAHDDKWVDNLKKTESVSCSNTQVYCPMLWIELDRKDYNKVPDLDKALKDGQHIVDRIEVLSGVDNVAWNFTSGNNSSHVLVNGSLFGNPIVSQDRTDVFHRLALKLAGDVRYSNSVVDPYRLSEEDLKSELFKVCPDAKHQKWDTQRACATLENIDPNIYRTNSLIRQPWSVHESSGRPKQLVGNHRPQQLEIAPHKPILLEYYFDAWERPKTKKKIVDRNYNSSYIIQELSKVFPDIQHRDPNPEGWIKGFYNPFYNDGNPDLSINIETGYLFDFGSQKYSMSFDEFLIKSRQL